LLGPNVIAVGIASTGFIIDTHFASYLPDPSSIPAIQNAYLIFTLPLTLIAQAIGQSLLPQITVQATHGRYVRMSRMILKIVGGSILVSIPITVIMYVLGLPMIRILYQRGAFNTHSSTLTYTVLIGYAVGLAGLAASALLISSFYALKDAWTPLFTNILTVSVRIGLIVLLLKLLTVGYAILAIPLALSLSGTLEAGFLGIILFLRLNAKMKTDKGMQRLIQRRLQAKGHAMLTKELASQQGSKQTKEIIT